MTIFVNLNLQTFKSLNIMRSEVNYFKNVLWIALIFVSTGIFAQELEDAKKLFNEGAEAVNADDLELAIQKFTEAADIANTVYEDYEDEEAENIMYMAQEQIPKLYFKLATTKLQNKEYKAGLEAAYNARETADSFGDDDTYKKASSVISKVHYQMGATKYKKSDFDGALVELDKAIEVNPDYSSPYYMKAAILKQQDKDDEFKKTCVDGIDAAKRSADSKDEAKIIKLASGHFLKKGNEAKGAAKYNEAIEYLNSAMSFDPSDGLAPYLLASVYEAQGKYDDAITAAKKSIANESDAEEKAKAYMIVGNAYFQKGDKASACDAYSKAAVGQYAEMANYKIEHEIKCNE